jgi:putative nucleotidyltransferase with HDIG domain
MATKFNTILEVKVPVSRLREGMFVCRLDKPWVESTFLFQGFLITDDKLIQRLTDECNYVYIDENRGIAADKSLSELAKEKGKEKEKPKKSFLDKLLGRKGGTQFERSNTNKLRDIVELSIPTEYISPPAKLLPFDEEINTAKQVHTSASLLIRDFMSHVKQGGPIDIIVAKNSVYDCMSSILRSPDAMLLLMRLRKKDYNLWQHSMNVSVLAISLGRYLNLHDDELVLLGLCGMFHDIGKLRIPKTALEAATSKAELQAILNSHTTIGRDILLSNMGQLAEVAARVAYTHHENLDGSGFPQGLENSQISAYSRMISIVDLYDNLTSDRPGKKAVTHYDAMTALLEKAGTHFDETLVNSFNKCIGTYPVGCVVEMNSGEIAMVVEENESQRLRPKIMLLTNAEKEKTERKVVDLADFAFSNNDSSYYIKAIINAHSYGINL